MANEGITLRFKYLNLIFTVKKKTLHDWEKLLGAEAEVIIVVNGKILFWEPYINVGELATQLHYWLKNGFENGEDFDYQGVEFSEGNVLAIKKSNSGWKIASRFQLYGETCVLDADEIANSITDFAIPLVHRIKEEFGVDISKWLAEKYRS